LVGGHGCIEDFPYNNDIKTAVEIMYNDVKGCVAAICHGPLGLLNCNSVEKPLLKGKFVAAFSNEEEQNLGFYFHFCYVIILFAYIVLFLK
jgi:putative intracellular protease/amidase